MKPATKLRQISPSLYAWSSFHTEWKINFDSYAIVTDDGVLFIDPVKPAPAVLKKLTALGTPAGVLLTSGNHDRDADWFRKQFDIQIYAQEKAPAETETKLDLLILDGEVLPGRLKAIHLPGCCGSETAYLAGNDGGILILGDSILNPPGKGLTLLPDQYAEDHKQMVKSVKKLRDLKFSIVTFSHGEPLVKDAKKQITGFIKQLGQ